MRRSFITAGDTIPITVIRDGTSDAEHGRRVSPHEPSAGMISVLLPLVDSASRDSR